MIPAMWRYNSLTGEFRDCEGRVMDVGYSGFAHGLNNPDKEGIRGIGPIPRGRYIVLPSRLSLSVGPVAMDLVPLDHDACGRSELMIHGDTKSGRRDASRGCIILKRSVREAIDREVRACAPDYPVLEVV